MLRECCHQTAHPSSRVYGRSRMALLYQGCVRGHRLDHIRQPLLYADQLARWLFQTCPQAQLASPLSHRVPSRSSSRIQ